MFEIYVLWVIIYYLRYRMIWNIKYVICIYIFFPFAGIEAHLFFNITWPSHTICYNVWSCKDASNSHLWGDLAITKGIHTTKFRCWSPSAPRAISGFFFPEGNSKQEPNLKEQFTRKHNIAGPSFSFRRWRCIPLTSIVLVHTSVL